MLIDTATLYGLTGAAVVGLGLYGFLSLRNLLRRVLAFNLVGSGIFLMFGAAGARDGAPGAAAGADPVPQALIITGIVVALSASALAVALIVAHSRAGGADRIEDERA